MCGAANVTLGEALPRRSRLATVFDTSWVPARRGGHLCPHLALPRASATDAWAPTVARGFLARGVTGADGVYAEKDGTPVASPGQGTPRPVG